MPSPPTSPQPEIEDLRPLGYWGRHPLVKVVAFTALGAGVLGPLWVEGDSAMLLIAGSGFVLMPIGIAGAVGQMRGNVSPLPGNQWKLVSPIASAAWSTALLVTCIALGLGVLTSMDEPAPWFTAAALLAAGLVIVGLYIQVASLSDQWPDKWRPPYARQPPATEPADDPAAGDDPERPT